MRIVVALSLFLACAPQPGGDTTTDASTVVDGGDPTTAPPDSWSYVHVPEAKCGNGTETGFGVNLHPGATTLVLYLQGGGACWEVGACYVVKTATHVEDTVQQAVVLAEANSPGLGLLFDRDDAANPVRAAAFAYLPYCTADLHSGTHVQRYEALGQVRDLHHVGSKNLDAFLSRLVPLSTGVTRVVLAGASAGGYGALINRSKVQRAFGSGVRVDVLDDSGLPIAIAWDRFGTAMQAWQPEWPAGCADCATTGYPALLPNDATAAEAHRTALLGYRQDSTIAAYFGVSGAEIQTGLDAQKAALASHQRFFLLDGSSHVLLGTPLAKTSGGIEVRQWVRDFLSDAPGWNSVGP